MLIFLDFREFKFKFRKTSSYWKLSIKADFKASDQIYFEIIIIYSEMHYYM